MLSPARNEAVSSSFRTVLLRQSPHTLPSACRRRPRLQQRSSDDKTARRWQKQGFPGRGRKCEHPVAGCCCSSSIRLPRSSIMSGFFWCSWSKLVRAHRAPPPQLRYTTSHSSPGRIRDCLWTRRDLTPNRRRVEPPAPPLQQSQRDRRPVARSRAIIAMRRLRRPSLGLPPFPSSRPHENSRRHIR